MTTTNAVKAKAKAKAKDPIKVKGLFNDGNAFAILGKCRRAMRKAGWTEAEQAAFSEEARAGNYDHLLQVVMRSFAEMSDDDEQDEEYARMDAEMEANDGHGED